MATEPATAARERTQTRRRSLPRRVARALSYQSTHALQVLLWSTI